MPRTIKHTGDFDVHRDVTFEWKKCWERAIIIQELLALSRQAQKSKDTRRKRKERKRNKLISTHLTSEWGNIFNKSK